MEIDRLKEELVNQLQKHCLTKDRIAVYKLVLAYKQHGVGQSDMTGILEKYASDYYDTYGDDSFYDHLYDLLDAVTCSCGMSNMCIYNPDYIVPDWAK